MIDGEGIPTLIQWSGGPVALTRLINAFYDRVEADELLSPFFPDGVSQTHRDHVAAWWIEVLGGPATYTEQLGGYQAMLSHHRGLGITSEQRLRLCDQHEPSPPAKSRASRVVSTTFPGVGVSNSRLNASNIPATLATCATVATWGVSIGSCSIDTGP